VILALTNLGVAVADSPTPARGQLCRYAALLRFPRFSELVDSRWVSLTSVTQNLARE
jgi:hypothetical protein